MICLFVNSELKIQNVAGLSQKGDTLTHDGTNYVAVPVGTDGTFLEADSTNANGVKWTSSIPNIRLTPASTVGSPALGEIWFDITNQSLTTQTVTGALNDPLLFRNVVDTTTGITLGFNHMCKTVTCTSANPMQMTVPANATTAFPIGAEIELMRMGAGVVQIVAANGVTVHSDTGYLYMTTQYTAAKLKKIATNTWVAYGRLAANPA